MAIEDIFKWYQKKIGTYDKQLWEKTLEQRIINGLTHIQMKSAKPKTDLIDLDLVRGSSFTKAKPKHGFITVARLATLRLLFLPLYAKWWVRQTSIKVFLLFLILYLSEFINFGIYWYNTSKLQPESRTVPSSEIVIPMLMMWTLSLIHSEIVATNSGPDRKQSPMKKCKRYRQRRSRPRKVSFLKKTLVTNPDVHKHDLESCANKDMISEDVEQVDGKLPETVQPKSNKSEDANLTNENTKVQPEAESCTLKSGSSGIQSGDNSSTGRKKRHIRYSEGKLLNSNGMLIDDDGFESLSGNGSSGENCEDLMCSGDQTVAEKFNGTFLSGGGDHIDKPADQTFEEVCNNTRATNERCDAWVKNLHEKFNYKSNDIIHESSESESDTSVRLKKMSARRSLQIPVINISSTIDSTCDTEDEAFSSPEIGANCSVTEEVTTGTDWIGITTNSEDCSYSSDYESDSQVEANYEHFTYDIDLTPTAILSPCCAPSDRVSCTIWERTEIKKADLSVFDISSVIISKVESMPESMDYFYLGIVISTILAVVPSFFRLCNTSTETNVANEIQISIIEMSELTFNQLSASMLVLTDAALGTTTWERSVMIIAGCQRWILSVIFFFLLSVAERAFKQRFLYAKLFSHLTSLRRARKSDLPHFRLNKVRNIKTWLSVRSYLRKRGLQRSVDVIVSAAFIITLLLLSFLSMEILKDTVGLHSQYNIEAMIWSIGLGILLLRFMTLGTKINRKYRNLSVLIMEQINLYLQIEQKPEKKNELMVANSVLKLAADLLKELESPFKISGLSANPYLYNITKVVILSALSGVLSDMLGFKLKLHKIKVK